MILMEPNRTPYDLRWRMFGIEVRVHPMFWAVSALMGLNTLQMGFAYLAAWVGCMFASILIHELGHIWMGQAFGSHGHIVLYGFGGLAIGSNRLYLRWQRIAVSFAGPLAGFAFLGGIFGFLWLWDPDGFPFYFWISAWRIGLPIEFGDIAAMPKLQSALGLFVIEILVFINLLWGLVNLLPVWPLDGGQISRDVCEGLSPDTGLERSLILSMAVAGLLAIHCFLVVIGKQLLPLPLGSSYTALMFAVLALQSFQMFQQAQSEHRWHDDRWRDR
jgi:stage IV sporulation protein FB